MPLPARAYAHPRARAAHRTALREAAAAVRSRARAAITPPFGLGRAAGTPVLSESEVAELPGIVTRLKHLEADARDAIRLGVERYSTAVTQRSPVDKAVDVRIPYEVTFSIGDTDDSGAKKSQGTVTLARARAQLVHADGYWAIFTLRGRQGIPDRGTTHEYRIDISRDELLEALQGMMSKSNHPKLSKALSTLFRELLAY